MAATPVARVAFAADSGGGGSSTAPKVAAAINAAFGRFAHPAQTSLSSSAATSTRSATRRR
jgi:hypothetical protein